MADALQDPAEAVPRSVAAALADVSAQPELALVAGSLTLAARRAVGFADAVRTWCGRDQLDVEHLVLGLRAQNDTTARSAFDDAGLDLDALLARLRAEGLDAPPPDVFPTFFATAVAFGDGDAALPPVSAHVSAALAAAGQLAGVTGHGTAPTRVRHLLAGVFAQRASHAIQRLSDVQPLVADLVRRAIEAETPDDEEARVDARRQLAALERLWAADPSATPRTARTGTGGGAANDSPEGDDRLNFAHYVEAFAHLIDSPETSPPLTIGIFGAWGSGKSFLLRHIKQKVLARSRAHRPTRRQLLARWVARQRRRLRGEAEPKRTEPASVYCIEFNAWEYNAADHIWPRLVRRVLDEVEREVRWHRTPLRAARTLVRKLKRNFGRKLRADWKTLLSYLAIGAGAWWSFAHLNPVAAHAWADRFLGVDTKADKFTVPAIVGGVTALGKLLRDTVLAPLGGWVTALLDDGPAYGGENDFVRAVQSDLRLVDGQLLAEGSRVLIIIDDLDRCEPNKAVEVLQAINQLLDRRSFVICLGIDARVITAAVEKHYEDLLGPAGITGYEYLDKIVQIPFRIPDPTGDDVAHLVSKQLGDPRPLSPPVPDDRSDAPGPTTTATGAPAGPRVTRPPDDRPSGAIGAVQPPSDESAATRDAVDARAAVVSLDTALTFTHEELQAFADIKDAIRPNPRHIKRLVNVYALVRSLAHLGRNRTILDDPASTIRWLTLCAQWPYAVHCMVAHLDRNPHLAAPDSETPPLRMLYDAVRTTLDPARCARFDHDRTGLESLVASSGGLSWRELAVLRGYTVNFNPALDAELRAEIADTGLRPRRRGLGVAAPYDRRADAPRPGR